MIILITGNYKIYDYNGRYTGKKEELISHGVDMNTFRDVVLPCVPPEKIGTYDRELGWVLHVK